MGIANANSILDIISYTLHGTKETAYYNDLLLHNIELPNDITLVSLQKDVITPSPLNNSPSENLQNTKSYSSDKSHTAKIKRYINQKFDQAAWKYLKYPILTEIKNHLDKNNTNIKKKNRIQSPRNDNYHLIRGLRSNIKTPQSEVHFLRRS